jgi:hypothetical protein
MRDLDQLLTEHVRDNTPDAVPDFRVVRERAALEGREPARIRGRRRALLAVAAAAALVVGTWGMNGLLRGDDGARPAAEGPVLRSGALPEGGAASCVYEPTPDNLAMRAFAFDGTVTAIDTAAEDAPPDGDDLGYARVTFAVERWFTGGAAPEVVVQMSPPLEVPVVAQDDEGGPSYRVGTRLLVSGEPRWGGPDPLTDPVVWGCGFTVYWDAQTAQAWERTFGG